ncbi:homocysteine S-methyltransferase family protein [Acidaminococcus sp. NSJ-142]|jgi:5-methyltetrahydrofolate--homocysteine methyltransferase|uniref:homocysteine S-methyltransferase family protein n=1 Tax=Acidaminococcus TaxID=904 RepID=UPI000CFA72C6|nr:MULTISPECIES: homocysteine S-methyltransferase family protein [Acidaminococcus]MCD2434609.1 homocysteine S-methyltransferase family protein [Acidaminococcus hominis]RHK03882.1 homocysteine methyltransferase [Acidaminococcus sp. AM05-11]
MKFQEALYTKRLFFDGAMGTMLQEAGLKPGELPETWNLLHPEKVQAIHRAYVRAGVDILKTNTFGANALKFGPEHGTPNVEELVRAGVENARAAFAAEGREGFVALDLGPTGKLLQPFGDLPFEEAVALYAQQVKAGAAAGADLILIETMSDAYEAKAAMLAAKENADLPFVCTFTFDQDGKLLSGADVTAALATAEALGAAAVGFNCGLGPDQLIQLVPQALQAVDIPLVMNPNAGLPVEENGHTVFHIGPEDYAPLMVPVAELGVAVLGGCCGTTPQHIAQLVAACRDLPLPPRRNSAPSVIAGYGSAVGFDGMPVIIGERINPTGKPRLKEALKSGNMDYVCQLALEQLDKGAQVLDVNVGVPGVNEPELIERVIVTLQSITSVPLQIDTSNIEAMERGLRIYNGRPLLNSVNGKAENLAEVLPLAAKYGAALVGLCLDENGIADSAAGRLKVADKIVGEAEKAGLRPRDMLLDPLAMTISTGGENAQIALAVIRNLKSRQLKTVMGVSNISFGLPSRDAVNSAFFSLAMEAGLSAGIINPNSGAMMQAYYAYGALSGLDSGCKKYVEYFADLPQVTLASKSQSTGKAAAAGSQELALDEAIIRGLPSVVEKDVNQLLADGKTALSIINEWMIPALNVVGEQFEKKKLFLPQLLVSADAAKAGFEILKQSLKTGNASEDGEPIVVCTVKGDIHDIGKNIVKVLLENYGYRVIDLGKDVPPEKVVAAAVENGAKLVGLSALMTTTVSSMAETIRQLRKALPGCKVMVGGAVMTEEYAKSIGADFYGANAVASVHYANALFGKK